MNTSKGLDQLSPSLGQAEWDFAYAIGLRYTKSPIEAEEVAQDTLLSAFRHRQRFRGESKYSTWLYRIATTTALMHLRAQGRRKRQATAHALYDKRGNLQIDPPSQTPSADERMKFLQELQTISESIEELAPKYSKLLRLRWFAQLSEKEVAERLDLPLSTVKTRAHRGRKHVLSPLQVAA